MTLPMYFFIDFTWYEDTINGPYSMAWAMISAISSIFI